MAQVAGCCWGIVVWMMEPGNGRISLRTPGFIASSSALTTSTWWQCRLMYSWQWCIRDSRLIYAQLLSDYSSVTTRHLSLSSISWSGKHSVVTSRERQPISERQSWCGTWSKTRAAETITEFVRDCTLRAPIHDFDVHYSCTCSQCTDGSDLCKGIKQ